MNAIDDVRSLANRAYTVLRGEILHGELMPGAMLRAAELKDRFGLGLTPIREAIMRLSTEGLVDAATHRSARVTEATVAELADLMATRRQIERLCLTQAMQQGDAAWEAEIVASLHLLSRTSLPASTTDRASATLWEERHRRFHAALVAACSSGWLMKFWMTLADHSERYRKVRLLHHQDAHAMVRDVSAEHSEIMEAVISRDIDRATRLMDTHLLATEQAVACFFCQGKKVEPS
jgi:GntR family carbon starvation induced transcriptional regulator